MDISKTINSYEEKKEKKASDADKEKADRIKRHRLNAEATIGHIKKVIKPVLQYAASKITERGYLAEVADISRPDHAAMPNDVQFAISIQMKASKDEAGIKSYADFSILRYDGDFESQTLEKSVVFFNQANAPRKDSPRRLNDVTKEVVEKDVESFIEEIFTVAS